LKSDKIQKLKKVLFTRSPRDKNKTKAGKKLIEISHLRKMKRKLRTCIHLWSEELFTSPSKKTPNYAVQDLMAQCIMYCGKALLSKKYFIFISSIIHERTYSSALISVINKFILIFLNTDKTTFC